MRVQNKAAGTHGGTGRINLFLVVLFVAAGLIVYRLFNLTYTKHSDFAQSAQQQYNNPSVVLSGRGDIYLSDLSGGARILAATNRSGFFIFSNNKNIEDADAAAESLAAVLSGLPAGQAGADPSVLKSNLSDTSKSYFVIAQNITKAQADKIRSLKLAGIGVASQVDRYYVTGDAASQVLGFVGFEGISRVGQYGVESYYDAVLSGQRKTLEFLGNKTYSGIAGVLNSIAAFFDKDKQKQTEKDLSDQDGSDLVLTLDENIQSVVELKLNNLLKKWSSPSGTIIVQDPRSGEILAMASSPSFDPNNYSRHKLSDFINPGVQQIFEPGSSFKPITMAAAVDAGAVAPETGYEDTGEAKFGSYVIKNFDEKANGWQTMRQVLQKSLNTGAIYAQQKTGDDAFLNYVVGFGFGQKTGIDLPGEVGGNISNLYSGRKINFATASFGQGIAVTPIQLINAYSAIANGGKLMRPYIVKEIIRPDGTKTEIKPKVIGAPIKDTTARELQSMLIDVVDRGFDKARVEGYDIAGKTGTAQIPDDSGGYSKSEQFIHDFVGFAPAYDPRFTILIKMDKPQGIKFAADSLSPTFGDIARFLIRYFNIPPSR